MYTSSSVSVAHWIRPRPEGKIMAQANLRLGDGAFMDKSKTLDPVVSQIARAFGHDSIIRREDSEG